MDLSWRFDLWFHRLPRSPKDEGHVKALVRRPPAGGTGAREIVEQFQVTPAEGVIGDRWSVDEGGTSQAQVTLVNIHVLTAIAGPELERRALSGDNLQVDLDLSEKNLPPGTRLEVGSAVLEVSTQPHTPCKKFLERYGVTVVKKVLRANKTGRRGRGMLCSVVQAGEFNVGDAIRVIRG
jgi:MOSC domain-containing protein YiiM